MSEYINELLRRKKIFTDNQAYFQKCALIIVGASSEAQAALTDALTAAGLTGKFTNMDDVLVDGADFSAMPRIHVITSASTLICDFAEKGKPGYPIEGSMHTSFMPALENMPAEVQFLYRQLYVVEENVALPLARLLRDRTGDLEAYALVNLVDNYHSLQELQRILDSEEVAEPQ